MKNARAADSAGELETDVKGTHVVFSRHAAGENPIPGD
jgi:hypothetical protein